MPLPGRSRPISKQETAVAIRDGRRAAKHLAVIRGSFNGSTASGERSISGASRNARCSARPKSLSMVLEQDFTVPGKKSSLLCPFAEPVMNRKYSQGASTLESDQPMTPPNAKDFTPHGFADPICAAMYAETMSSPPPSQSGSAAKCPIRYLDQHSPEEVARYFETHKHEIPRSHEVCVKRYQRNEEDIRKLDAKYGNLVSMIQGLGQTHQPMLPANQDELDEELECTSNEKVESWAKDVNADGVEHAETAPEEADDRESRFDRQMKEVRVGESPSRPWGIWVPISDPTLEMRPASPATAPVSSEHLLKPVTKCPFGQGQQDRNEDPSPTPVLETTKQSSRCPFGHDQKISERQAAPDIEAPPIVRSQPAFITSTDVGKMGTGGPQMIFTGPVFVGYPMEQALTFMQQYKGAQ